MANVVFDSLNFDVGAGNVDFNTDTFKIMLVTSAYTPNKSAHTKRSDITNEVVGTGYTAGGATLAGVTWTNDTVNHKSVLTADNPLWANSTITARGAVIYKSRGGAASADEVVMYQDFGSDITSTNGPFTVNFNAAGILELA